jgi:hypothetical protein
MRIPQETLEQWEITDADKAALADLPDAVEPFFQPDLQGGAQPVMRGGLYRIANDLGLEIGVGARGVFAVDPQDEMPDLRQLQCCRPRRIPPRDGLVPGRCRGDGRGRRRRPGW